MARKTKPQLLIVDGPEDVPAFPDEKAEAIFWGTHRFSDRLLAEMRPPTDEEAPPARHGRAISLRVGEGLLERLQVLAEKAQKPYQSLLKEYVADRVELEERRALGQHGTILPQERSKPPTDQAPETDTTPPDDPPLGQITSVWVDVILAATPDPSRPILIQGRLPAHPQFLTLNNRLTVEEGIEFLEYLRDLKNAPKSP